jgi:hypothetical protein
MPLTTGGTLASPEATTQSPGPARAKRCRMLDRRQNRCPNPQLTDFGLCIRHLGEAAAEHEAVLAEAAERLAALNPGLAGGRL